MSPDPRPPPRSLALVGITLSGLLACESPAPAPSRDGAPNGSAAAVAITPSVGGGPTRSLATAAPAVSTASALPPAASAAAAPTAAVGASAGPLRIAYSRDPEFAAWQRVATSGALARRELDVQLTAYAHAAALEAFSAGRADAVAATHAEVLVNRSLGSPCTVVAVTSARAGGEALFARAAVTSVSRLRGKTIGVELGQPEHLALERGLGAAGVELGDVRLVNVVPEVAHREFTARSLDAVMVPRAVAQTLPQRLQSVHRVDLGERPLVYGVLCVRAESLAARRAEWTQVVRAWEENAGAPAASLQPSLANDVRSSGDAMADRWREELLAAARDFDAFYVRLGGYGRPQFADFSANDVVWHR